MLFTDYPARIRIIARGSWNHSSRNWSTHDFVRKRRTKFGWTLIRLNWRAAMGPQSKPWIAVWPTEITAEHTFSTSAHLDISQLCTDPPTTSVQLHHAFCCTCTCTCCISNIATSVCLPVTSCLRWCWVPLVLSFSIRHPIHSKSPFNTYVFETVFLQCNAPMAQMALHFLSNKPIQWLLISSQLVGASLQVVSKLLCSPNYSLALWHCNCILDSIWLAYATTWPSCSSTAPYLFPSFHLEDHYRLASLSNIWYARIHA